MLISFLMVSALALSSEFRKPLSTLITCSNSATNVAFVFTTFFTFDFSIFFLLNMEIIISEVSKGVNRCLAETSRNLKL